VRYQLVIHGGYNPQYYHFSDPNELVRWLVQEEGIVEVTVREVP
jgi:hypothetical protein